MTHLEAAALINKPAIWNAGNGLSFRVSIKDIKRSYGCTRYLVAPIDGSGETWVQTGISFV
jgi:hypothetical protein